MFVCLFVFIPESTDGVNLPNKNQKAKLTNLILMMPIFFFGVIFADLETMKNRPLDAVRNLHWGWKIPINLFLALVVVSWGSYEDEGRCLRSDDGNCDYWYYATIMWYLPRPVVHYTAAVLLIFFALTSSWFQWVLASPPFEFMGRISYSLYLLHELFTDGIMIDTYYNFIG